MWLQDEEGRNYKPSASNRNYGSQLKREGKKKGGL